MKKYLLEQNELLHLMTNQTTFIVIITFHRDNHNFLKKYYILLLYNNIFIYNKEILFNMQLI